jgi:hypothetical protein
MTSTEKRDDKIVNRSKSLVWKIGDVLFHGASYRERPGAHSRWCADLGGACSDAVMDTAERQKLFAMLTYQVAGKAVGIALAIALLVGAVPMQATAQARFVSKERAFTKGYSAFKSGRYDVAVPALKFAARRDVMRAKFYLAKIYSDNSGGFTDHARAYKILRDIVSTYGNVDPKDYRKAPYVSKALISIARYVRDGIPALQLKPNTKQALSFFDHAASYFNDADAQFELAKHYLEGNGVEARVPYALNWLARLSKRGHAGSQTFLANLYWDGRYTKRDPVRALALITVAVENAREGDRSRIEDVHKRIFCSANRQTRLKVHGVIKRRRERFGRPQPDRGRERKRRCANGDVVGDLDGATDPDGSLSGYRNCVDGRVWLSMAMNWCR